MRWDIPRYVLYYGWLIVSRFFVYTLDAEVFPASNQLIIIIILYYNLSGTELNDKKKKPFFVHANKDFIL